MKVLRDSTCTDIENDFFSQKFLRYVGDFLMPYFPLWSAMILTKVGLYRDSNAAKKTIIKFSSIISLCIKKGYLRQDF